MRIRFKHLGVTKTGKPAIAVQRFCGSYNRYRRWKAVGFWSTLCVVNTLESGKDAAEAYMEKGGISLYIG